MTEHEGPGHGHPERSLRMTVRPDEIGEASPTVGQIAMRPPIACRPEATVHEAATMMAKHKIGALVIDGGEPRIITERDVVFAAAERAIDEPVSTYATVAPVSIASDASVEEAARLMVEEGVRHLLVEEAGRIIGVFTVRDLIANQVVRLEHH